MDQRVVDPPRLQSISISARSVVSWRAKERNLTLGPRAAGSRTLWLLNDTQTIRELATAFSETGEGFASLLVVNVGGLGGSGRYSHIGEGSTIDRHG